MSDTHANQQTEAGWDVSDAFGDLASDARNVLVLAPTHGGHWHRACNHFHTRAGLDTTNVLVLTYVLGSSDYVDRLQRLDQAPASVAVIEATGDTTPPTAPDAPFDVDCRHEAPGDLTGIGIQCSEFLTRWHDTGDVSVCVESITSMLQYAPIQTAYRFLHVLTHRVSHADAVAHYHMSPDAHTQQELGTIKQLFDAVATYDQETDDWTVMER